MQRLVVGITGATGIIYGIRLLEVLRNFESIEVHLVLSKPAIQTLAIETTWTRQEVQALAHCVYSNEDIGAALASGSFQTHGMIIIPCTIHTLSSVAQSLSNTLIARAADVMLKERRRLVLVVRETPLHLGHLQSMLHIAQMGGIIAPPVPAFYQKPQSIDDLINHTVGRLLDLMGIQHDLIQRWKESSL